MAIRVQCTSCQSQFTARDELAGRQGKCPKCQAPITVPAAKPSVVKPRVAAPPIQAAPIQAAAPLRPAAAVPVARTVPAPTPVPAAPPIVAAPPAAANGAQARPVSREVLAAQLARAFRGDIEGVPVGVLYRVGILLVAMFMVLLPIAYLAVIAAAAGAVWYHAVNHTGILSMGTGRGKLVAVSLYAGPIVAGAIMVFFMLKPLFARPVNSGRTRSLTRQGEPLLFGFVDRICQAVGARQPARIDIDYDLNASAGLDDTRFKLFRNRLVLTIGVPLAAGLNTSQLAGVLAHEFGHFTQGAGMRLTYVIRSINGWFARVVYQRDAWDAWLEETADGLDFRIGWVLQLARLAVFLSRRILWVFMMLGHGVSSFMMRQMEFHADAHEARLVGSEVFESTTRRLAALAVAYRAALEDLGHLAENGKPPDNLPLLVMTRADTMPGKLSKLINDELTTSQTGWFDSHPASAERIRRAALEADEPLFADARPAAQLFTNFSAVARGVTSDVYRIVFGIKFQPSMMHSTEALLKEPREKASEPPREISLD